MLKLSLEALEIVETIDRQGSFTAAAERLHKVPSTISYAVSKLEEQLGLALFVRNGPRVALTPAWQEMLKEGRWLLAAARILVDGGHFTLTELINKIDEVKKRHEPAR